MPLSCNEIRHNAVKFARDHKHATSESADKQTFWNEFFDVFGSSRKLVASFEVPVRKCYRPEPFQSARERVEYHFSLYEKLTAPLLPPTPKTKGRRSQTAATTP